MDEKLKQHCFADCSKELGPGTITIGTSPPSLLSAIAGAIVAVVVVDLNPSNLVSPSCHKRQRNWELCRGGPQPCKIRLTPKGLCARGLPHKWVRALGKCRDGQPDPSRSHGRVLALQRCPASLQKRLNPESACPRVTCVPARGVPRQPARPPVHTKRS